MKELFGDLFFRTECVQEMIFREKMYKAGFNNVVSGFCMFCKSSHLKLVVRNNSCIFLQKQRGCFAFLE